MQPILRWAGSKRYLLQTLLSRFPKNYERYIEPFCGSASLFFFIEPKHAILGDANSELISMYKTLRDDYEGVFRILEALPAEKDTYYKVRSIDPATLTDVQKAARFLYLNRNCFNGLYRTNKLGKFNVPFSGLKNGRPISKELLQNAGLILKRANLKTGDFHKCLQHIRPLDFVYLDPPYATNERRTFCEYGPNSFKTEDLRRLSEQLDLIDRRGAYFLLSYAACSEAKSAFGNWTHTDLNIRRNIAGFAGHRKEAKEYLFSNY